VGASTSHNPKGLQGLLRGKLLTLNSLIYFIYIPVHSLLSMFYRFYNISVSVHNLIVVLSTAELLFPMVDIFFYHEDEGSVFL
jgi:hypothetical protein